MKTRILVVDDEHEACAGLVEMLGNVAFEVASRTSAGAALALLAREDFDVVFADVKMEGSGGLEFCRQVASLHPEIPVVMMTGFASMETAVEAIRAGACDFVRKPLEAAEVTATLERAAARGTLHYELRHPCTTAPHTRKVGEMIGSSASMTKVHDLVARVAQAEASILIVGESGTGKELVAHAVHAASRRAAGPFVAINCAAMPEGLLESELFGHAKGAFTDARQARQGLFLQASGGTLLLDEIGEMPLAMQSKLLRVLQERTVRPVGDDREVPCDVRIVAATNRNLDVEVAQGRFRQDLFYRVNVVRIDVPPLRERGRDVLELAQAFVVRYASVHRPTVKGLTAAAGECLVSYSWPGNVRELQNGIERAVALAPYELLCVDDLPEKLRGDRLVRATRESDVEAGFRPFHEVGREHVMRVLDAVHGNKTQAAVILGLDRRTLYRKLRIYGVLPGGAEDAGNACQTD